MLAFERKNSLGSSSHVHHHVCSVCGLIPSSLPCCDWFAHIYFASQAKLVFIQSRQLQLVLTTCRPCGWTHTMASRLIKTTSSLTEACHLRQPVGSLSMRRVQMIPVASGAAGGPSLGKLCSFLHCRRLARLVSSASAGQTLAHPSLTWRYSCCVMCETQYSGQLSLPKKSVC